MADRTAAGVFGKIFMHLAETNTKRDRELAQWLFTQTGDFDFSTYQMDADKALLILGVDTSV